MPTKTAAARKKRHGRRGRSNITIRLDDDVIDLLDTEADDEGVSRSEVVRWSLTDYLGREVR